MYCCKNSSSARWTWVAVRAVKEEDDDDEVVVVIIIKERMKGPLFVLVATELWWGSLVVSKSLF